MKVLIIGFGSIAKKHCKALLSIDPKIEIYALRSNQKAAAIDGIINLFASDDLLKIDFSFIIISSPTFLREKHIYDVIKLNTPLFIEKPLSNTLAIENLIHQININQTKTYVACNLRFLDCLVYVKDHYVGTLSKINEVNSYCGSYLPSWRPDQDYKTVYSANATLGGGVHLDLIHELDYLYWLFGKPKKSIKLLKSNSSLQINAVDYANYNLEYDGFISNVVLNYFRRDSKRTLEIVLDDKTILVNLLENKVYENGIVVFESSQKILDTYERQLNYFINTLNSDKELFNDINEAYEILKICL
jgi:predicted dehydrogenase